MEILQYPNDALKVITTPVEKVTPELVEVAKQMYMVMKKAEGIGLAAPQVGLTMSLLVLENNGALIMFNPKTMKKSIHTEYANEGCLSFDGVTCLVKRALEVTVKYRDVNNRMQYVVLKGLLARAYLHEADHLNGILFTEIGKEISK